MNNKTLTNQILNRMQYMNLCDDNEREHFVKHGLPIGIQFPLKILYKLNNYFFFSFLDLMKRYSHIE
jgi:hypothetical protein